MMSNVPKKTWFKQKIPLKVPQDLAKMAQLLSVELPLSDDLAVLAQPMRVGELEIPNSLAIDSMEGCDGDSTGCPGPLTMRRYERYAVGGAGLIWVEAMAVVPEGRASPRQLWLHEGSFESMAAMVARLRGLAQERFGSAHRPFLVAQLTHSGRYSHAGDVRNPQIIQHDPYRDTRMNLPVNWPVVRDEYLDRLPQAFVQAARLAFNAGFDAVDVKACRGCLLAELLASHTRGGKYGGSLENRIRLMLEIIDRIRGELGQEKIIATRLGVFDAIAYPYGWGVDQNDCTRPDLTEPLKLIKILKERGIAMINVTIACPYYNPHYCQPFNKPARGSYISPEHPLVGVARIIGLAGQIQQAFPQLAVVGSGYSWLGALMPFVAAGVKTQGLATLIGLGRMAFAYPDFAIDIIQKGRLDPDKVCTACSACAEIMHDGGTTGCPVRDKETYGPIYRRVLAKKARLH